MKKSIIIFICGLILGLACTPFIGVYLRVCSITPVIETYATLQGYAEAVKLYHQKAGEYPATLTELRRNKFNMNFIEADPVDAWGHLFHYEVKRGESPSVTITSYGFDAAPGGLLESADLTVSVPESRKEK